MADSVTQPCISPDIVGLEDSPAIAGCHASTTFNQTQIQLHAGPPLKLSERVVRATPLSPVSIEQMLTSLNLGVQHGLDPDAANLVAAGTFAYGSLHSPMKVGTQASFHLLSLDVHLSIISPGGLTILYKRKLP